MSRTYRLDKDEAEHIAETIVQALGRYIEQFQGLKAKEIRKNE